MSSCSCLRKNNCNKIAVAGKFHHSSFIAILSNTETYICGDRYRSARRIRVVADGICRGDCRIVEHTVSRGRGDGDACDVTGGADRRDDRRRSLEATLHRHVGILLVRVDRCPESVRVKWSTTCAGDVTVARSLPRAGAFTNALSVTCSIATATTRTGTGTGASADSGSATGATSTARGSAGWGGRCSVRGRRLRR